MIRRDIVLNISNFQSNQWGAEKWPYRNSSFVLGQDLCKVLPFVYAITGCDATSRLFGVGKGQALKKAAQNLHFKECANSFSSVSSRERHQNALLLCMVELPVKDD